MKTKSILAILVMILVAGHCSLSQAEPMGTAFTYEGQFMDANSPAEGLYDFQFTLYDDPDPNFGMQIGYINEVNDLDVIEGCFTVDLDFSFGDPNVFNGDARWIEIAVRAGDLNDPNEYTILSPRQEVTPVPYALYALSGAPGSQGPKGDKGDTGATGSQGLPGEKGDKGDTGDTGATGSQGLPGEKGDKGDTGDTGATGSQGPKGDPGDSHWQLSGLDTYYNAGNVGIGTTSPGGKLQVAGDEVRIGDAGTINYANGDGDLYVEDSLEVDGGVRMERVANFNISGTAVYITSSGHLGVLPSSKRYKENIVPLEDDFSNILEAQPVTFTLRQSKERGIGFIAEDLDELGLSNLVIYDSKGRPDSIRYEFISLYLLEVIKDQAESIKQLQDENASLKKQLKAENLFLKQRLDDLEIKIEQYQFAVAKEVQQ